MRQIITKKDAENSMVIFQKAGVTKQPPLREDTISDKIIKYIPVEIVSIYVFLQKAVETSAKKPSDVTILVTIGVLFIANIAFMVLAQKVRRFSQVCISSIALLIWIYSLGEPVSVALGNYYNPLASMALLAFFTLIPPMFNIEK